MPSKGWNASGPVRKLKSYNSHTVCSVCGPAGDHEMSKKRPKCYTEYSLRRHRSFRISGLGESEKMALIFVAMGIGNITNPGVFVKFANEHWKTKTQEIWKNHLFSCIFAQTYLYALIFWSSPFLKKTTTKQMVFAFQLHRFQCNFASPSTVSGPSVLCAKHTLSRRFFVQRDGPKNLTTTVEGGSREGRMRV